MEWDKFKPLELQTPDEILKGVIKGFSEATGNLIEMTVFKKSDLQKIGSQLSAQFQFELALHSKYVKGYSFSVLELAYNIELYPFFILLDGDFYKELNNIPTFDKKAMIIESQENWAKTIELLFKSKQFNKIVSGLMKIASIELNKIQTKI